MRWPFRRKGATAAPEAAASHADAGVAPAPASATRRAAHHWASLPPLPVTIKSAAPLVMGPAPVLEPLPGRRTWSGASIPPATGRVEGLVHPTPVTPEPPVRKAEPTIPVEQPPLVHRTVHSEPPAPVSSLTDAVGDYVGEPREPAEPYRAPGWMRMVPEWLQQSGTSEAELGMASAGRPLNFPATPRLVQPAPEPPRPAPVVPQRVAEEPVVPEPIEMSTQDTPVVTSAPKLRRANLAQSRRLGLGAPLKRGAEQELILPAEPPAIEQTQAPQAVPPAPVSRPAASESDSDDTGEGPEPPPAPPPQPPPLVHRPPRAEEPAEPEPEPEPEPVRPSPVVAGPVVPSSGPVSQPAPPASAVPLVYRSTPPKPQPEAKPAVVRQAKVVPVPTGLASAIRGSHGVDVSDVLVHRGPEVSEEARSLGARAFTRDAEVFLPEEAGSLDAPQARGLLAHELVHVVQQRRLGTSLPSSSTSAGVALEAEAVAVEHEHAGHAHPPAEPSAPLVHPVLTQVLTQATRTAGVQLAPLIPESISSAPTVAAPSIPDTLSEPVRQQVDQISQESATRVVEQWTNPALGGSGFASFPVTESPGLPSLPSAPSAEPGSLAGTAAANEAEMANQVLQVINLDRASKGEPAISVLDERALEQIRQVIAEQTSGLSRQTMVLGTSSAAATGAALATEASTSLPVQQPQPAPAPVAEPTEEQGPTIEFGQAGPGTDPGQDEIIDLDRIDLDLLSARLYDRLRSRLRMELLVDRERAGLLTDFR